MTQATQLAERARSRRAQTVNNTGPKPGRVTQQLRLCILESARDARATHPGKEVSAVVARRLRIPEALVDEVILTELDAAQAENQILRFNVRHALDMGTKVAREIREGE